MNNGLYPENNNWCGPAVLVWNSTHSQHGSKQSGKPKLKERSGERGLPTCTGKRPLSHKKAVRQQRLCTSAPRALAMASQITTHCTTLSSPLFSFGNNNMYSMLHAPACSGTGSFCVSKRRATCPTVKPRTFLLKCRAAGKGTQASAAAHCFLYWFFFSFLLDSFFGRAWDFDAIGMGEIACVWCAEWQARLRPEGGSAFALGG